VHTTNIAPYFPIPPLPLLFAEPTIINGINNNFIRWALIELRATFGDLGFVEMVTIYFIFRLLLKL